MTEEIAGHTHQNFIEQLHQLEQAGSLTRPEQSKKLASAADVMISQKGGVALIYEHIGQIVESGFFTGTNWEDPAVLNSSLVGGTLKAGGMSTVYEILSELRVLAIATGRITSEGMSKGSAREFLENVIVTNLDLLFPDASEELRNVDVATKKHISAFFEFLQEEFIRWDHIGKRLAEELQMICNQRPIVTDRARSIIRLVRDKLTKGDNDEHGTRLQFFIDAVYAPSEKADKLTVDEYEAWLEKPEVKQSRLKSECEALADSLRKSGLASEYHAVLVRRVKDNPGLLGTVLGLNSYGAAELESHHEKVAGYISFACHPDTSRFVYGLAMMLERNLLSSQPVTVGLEQLMETDLHPGVEEAIHKSRSDSRRSAIEHLFADTVCMLGQPLGVGQGWNPTCQSARGMSLWSRHAPGKLLTMILTAATTNDLDMRFEGQLLKSSQLAEGLAKEFDFNLDAVSIVLVPHLDRIYFEMTRLAGGRGEDPHKWVNPAMYGQWIPTGFTTPYNYLINAIVNYEQFLQLFYVTHHPDYNGGHNLAYPSPVGIFLTAANGKLLGFHAVSILRVAKYKEDFRIYFLNPNNEGRQKWQSDMQPTVAGNGEIPGESSLPFHQFASRLYAFHYNPSEAEDLEKVSDGEIKKVKELAKNSWGTSYIWQDYPAPVYNF